MMFASQHFSLLAKVAATLIGVAPKSNLFPTHHP